MEKLLEDLKATHGLASMTFMQLNDLKWKTKQLIFVTLFQSLSGETTSSVLRELIEDRQLERHAEQTKQISMREKKASEKAFQSEFMQRVSRDLLDIGGSVNMNWEQLLANQESCYQAFRLLLTRIKSSQRVSRPTSSSGRRITTHRSSKAVMEERPAWNNGEDMADMAKVDTFGGPGMSFERTEVPVVAEKKKTISNTKWKSENEALRLENKRLKEELQDTKLYGTGKTDEEGSFDERRINFLRAQNQQLQRQIDLLLDALAAQQNNKVSFQQLLQKLQSIVETAAEDARNAGCEEDGKKTWMLAVPNVLLNEIQGLQQRIDQIERSSGRELHSALHSASYSEQAFVSTNASMLNVHGHGYAQVDISPVGHLRFDKLLELEGNLSAMASQLLCFSRDAMERCFVPVVVQSGIPPEAELASSARVLAQTARQLATDCSQLGSVVCLQAVGPTPVSASQETDELLRLLTPFSGTYRTKERAIKSILTRIAAQEVSMNHRVASCEHELKLWHRTYAQQYKCIHELVNGVKQLWEKKFSWIQEKMVQPLECFGEIVDDYHSSQHTSLHLLVETFDEHRETLLKCQQQFTGYVESLHRKLQQMVSQYNTSVQVIQEELLPPN